MGHLVRLHLLCSLALAGCLQSPAIECDDGLLCPAGTICTGDRCALPGQLSSCQARPDGEPCSFEGVPDGTCDRNVCIPAGCGNGVVEAGEQCDDGNREPRDGCSADCLSDERCGNGIVDGTTGEACDTAGASATCNADCTTAVCGDGKLNTAAGEQCDAGDVSTPTCDSDCTLPTCGDGFLNPTTPDNEQCDAGGQSATCDADCTVPVCGDGVHNVDAAEGCDDGNDDNQDDCLSTCQPNICGDGFTDQQGPVTEVCDDHNADPCGTCSASCGASQSPTGATGQIDAVALSTSNEDQTFTLDDGTIRITFEIVTDPADKTVALGHEAVFVFFSADAELVASQVHQAIARARTDRGFAISAVVQGSTVLLTNDNASGVGNTQSSSTVTASGFNVSDMSGGLARDCPAGTGCRSQNDCASGLCIAGVCN